MNPQKGKARPKTSPQRKERKKDQIVVKMQPASIVKSPSTMFNPSSNRNVKYHRTEYGSVQRPLVERTNWTVFGNVGATNLRMTSLNQVGGASSIFSGINPSNSFLFPVLAKTAINFNLYEFDFLEFEFTPEGSAFAANNQTGNAIIAFNPDARDPLTDSTVALTALPHRQHNIWTPFKFTVPKEHLRGLRYMLENNITVAPGSDVREYNVGTLIGGTFGCTNNDVVTGYIEARYGVSLYTPVNRTAGTGNSQYCTNSSVVAKINGNQNVNSGSTVVFPLSVINAVPSNPTPISATTNLNLGEGNWLAHASVCLLAAGTAYFTSVVVYIQDNSTGILVAVHSWASNGSTVNAPNRFTAFGQLPIFVPSNGTQSISLGINATTSDGSSYTVLGQDFSSISNRNSTLIVSPLP